MRGGAENGSRVARTSQVQRPSSIHTCKRKFLDVGIQSFAAPRTFGPPRLRVTPRPAREITALESLDGRPEAAARSQLGDAPSFANGQLSVRRDQSRNTTPPSPSIPTPNSITRTGVVAKRKIQPNSATSAGRG